MGSRFENQRGFPARGNRSRGRSNQPRGYHNDRSTVRPTDGSYGRDRQQGYPVRSSGYGEGYARARPNERPDARNSERGRLDQRVERVGEQRQPGSYADRTRSDYQGSTTTTKKEPDLHQLLQQISTTLVTLSGRIESLEKSKGPDIKIAAATEPTRPALHAGPLLPKSTNDDFTSISKALYKMVQLGHHESNWVSLPKSISERLRKLTEDINPPMGDAAFKQELEILTQQYGEEVRRLVSDHLVKKRDEVKTDAGSLNPVDVGRAKEVASKYLIARLGKRHTDQRRTELINSAASMIGANRKPNLVQKPKQANSDTDWTTVTHRSPPKVSGKTKKRKERSTPIENRFNGLTEEVSESMVEDVEPTHSPQVQSPAKKRPQNNLRNSDFEVITEHGVHVYSGLKSEWQVTPESSDTCVIVVGDSNLRKMKKIPKFWQVNALPGADLCDLTDGLTNLTGLPKQYTIVLQAGMNHRENHDDNDQADIRTMLFAMRSTVLSS